MQFPSQWFSAIKFSFLTLISLLFFTHSYASVTDSMRIVSFDDRLKPTLEFDSTLHNFQNQIPYIQNSHYAGLGAVALPQRNLLFDPSSYFGFRLMDNVYPSFQFQSKLQTYYHLLKPLTDMGFGVGSKKESYFSFLHTQNFGNYFNFATSLKTARTESFYKNQNPHYINFSVQFSFHSPNKKYIALANTTVNRIYHKENGGVDTISLFQNQTIRNNPEIVQTRQTSAVYKNYSGSFFLKQYYVFNLSTDTTEKNFELNQFGNKMLYHQCQFSEHWMKYADTLETFYQKPLTTDVTGIYDYLYHQQIENSLGFIKKTENDSLRFINYDVNVTHSYNYISQDALRTRINNIWLNANAQLQWSSKLKANVDIAQGLIGYNKGDYMIDSKIYSTAKSFGTWFDYGIHVSTQASEPTFVQQQYHNSHFEWKNQFDKINISRLGVFLESEKANLQLNYFQLTNFVYFDSTITPQQQSQTKKLLQCSISKPFKFNKFYVKSSILYQHTLAQNDYLKLPEIILNEQLYFEGFLFKHSLLSQAGIELTYSTKYKGNAYAPLLNQFYLQNNVNVGNYPQVDVFFNFKIKVVRVFVKISNANYSLMQNIVYYQTPYYPMYNQMFRLGLLWRFWD